MTGSITSNGTGQTPEVSLSRLSSSTPGQQLNFTANFPKQEFPSHLPLVMDAKVSDKPKKNDILSDIKHYAKMFFSNILGTHFNVHFMSEALTYVDNRAQHNVRNQEKLSAALKSGSVREAKQAIKDGASIKKLSLKDTLEIAEKKKPAILDFLLTQKGYVEHVAKFAPDIAVKNTASALKEGRKSNAPPSEAHQNFLTYSQLLFDIDQKTKDLSNRGDKKAFEQKMENHTAIFDALRNFQLWNNR